MRFCGVTLAHWRIKHLFLLRGTFYSRHFWQFNFSRLNERKNLNKIIHNYKRVNSKKLINSKLGLMAGVMLCVHEKACWAATAINIYIFGIDLHEFNFWRTQLMLLASFSLSFSLSLQLAVCVCVCRFPLAPCRHTSSLILVRMCKQKKHVRCCLFSWNYLILFIANSREKQSEQTVNWKLRVLTTRHFILTGIHQTITH